MRPFACALVVIAAFSLPAALTAQDTLPVTPGARVRVSAPLVYRRPIVATVVAQREGILMVRETDAAAMQWTLPLSQVERLEVSGGGGGAGIRAAIGFLVGATAGAFYGAAGHPGLRHIDIPEDAETAFYAGVAGLLGAVVGAATGGERWRRVPLPGRISIVPQPRGALGISTSFAY